MFCHSGVNFLRLIVNVNADEDENNDNLFEVPSKPAETKRRKLDETIRGGGKKPVVAKNPSMKGDPTTSYNTDAKKVNNVVAVTNGRKRNASRKPPTTTNVLTEKKATGKKRGSATVEHSAGDFNVFSSA